ncbi:MAG: molybdopterin cofactor-binding domain-containing protein, partial [Bacteroidales bacterium]
YTDGTMLVNHGGTEMGQGLHTKILQVAALEMGIPMGKIRVNATNTSKVPNTSPTAASSGSDLNGMAVKNAIEKLHQRLEPCARLMLHEQYGLSQKLPVEYEMGRVFAAGHKDQFITFEALATRAHQEKISMSATGYYSTPGIHFDHQKGKGKPFHYFAYGMAVSEVEVDILTGFTKVIHVDIIHDAGESINPAIDLGQVYGGFVQGMGWCIMETLRYDDQGNLLNHSAGTYKIPAIGDTPGYFNAELLSAAPNPGTIRRSKAVGEPPLMLALSVWLAVKDAISSVAHHQLEPYFQLPANNELIVRSVKDLRERIKSRSTAGS